MFLLNFQREEGRLQERGMDHLPLTCTPVRDQPQNMGMPPSDIEPATCGAQDTSPASQAHGQGLVGLKLRT